MAAAIVWIYLYLLATRELNLLEAGYCCARAFIVAEFAASVEWQFHCGIWPQRGAWEPLSLLLLAVVMAVTVFAVSNLSFVSGDEVTIVVFYIRTLVDFAGSERPA